MPRLAEREDGRVNQRARVQPLEVLTEVLDCKSASPHDVIMTIWDSSRDDYEG